MSRKIQIERLQAGEEDRLSTAADDVFNNAVQPHLAARFLRNEQNLLVAAFDGGLVVGMGSGIVYVHPDKDPELWINELGISTEIVSYETDLSAPHKH